MADWNFGSIKKKGFLRLTGVKMDIIVQPTKMVSLINVCIRMS